ncbi:MarR family transcriptional regulator [Mesosutterella sp. OilRF-GAM-744-9]|uniref:MarR family transcriptional regulator n=1 Tax=Mesosutterella porci TaxID=2915351 RepID=A0ABS9MSA5_9BURK|nr:MarR family transcriptional regulator [Mesosutterella sp. oilRF-744-WT-GAM-9]MCG5031495.1 MarR family transcriptional regulator [Mesosutterella sp. oilRF-744-WT-GAM-9]
MEQNTKIVWLASRLLENANEFIRGELRREGAADLTPAHGDILNSLYLRDGLSVSELARAARRTKSTVSVLVDRLAAAGYVEKRPSEEDSRAVGVWLTEKGRAFREREERISRRLNERLTRNLRGHEVAALEDFLERCAASFAGEDGRPK